MAASIAKSKLLNLRNPALQILLRRPTAAAAASIPAQSLNPPHPEKITPNSSTLINQNFHLPNLPQLPIEAARDYSDYIPAPSKDGDDYVDYDDMFDDDDDDDDDEEDLSGLEGSDDEFVEDGVEEDVEIRRRPIRK